MKNHHALILVVATAVAAVITWQVWQLPPLREVKPLVATSYVCNEGKSITAAFLDGGPAPTPSPGEPPTPTGRVNLMLSDGRNFSLKQTISADGVRYANDDDTFVFWSKGNSALVLENNEEKSYIGCVVVAPDAGGLPQVYHSAEYGFSIRLPQGYEVNEGQPGEGVVFKVGSSTWAGTNLSSDTHISVRETREATTCTADLFLNDRPVTARDWTDGGVMYSVASSTDAAAGNRYETILYALSGTNPCLAIYYFIHYGTIENYPKDAVKEFDKAALLKEFDAIRRSLTLVP